MKFNTIEEMVTEMQRITEGNIGDFEIDIKVKKIINDSHTEVLDTLTETEVQIVSLGGSPTVKVKIDESSEGNILYVDSYESIPLSCGSGRVSLLDRNIFTNICESIEDSPTINLNIKDGDNVINKTFRLSIKDSNSKYTMILNSRD